MTTKNLFPHHSDSLSLSLSSKKIKLDGMMVKFDKKTILVPAELLEKHQADRLVKAQGLDKKYCTIYVVAIPRLVEDLDGWVESKSGFVASIRNYVEDIYHDYNGLKNFKIKLVDSLEIPGFDPALDARVYLKRSGKNAAYNYSNANVNLDFFNGRPGTANGAAYLVAHEALHTYMARLGVLLFGSFEGLTPNGGHLDEHKGEFYPNLLMDGHTSMRAGNYPKYQKYTSERLTFLKDFRRIHPTQKYFLKEAHNYLSLSHPDQQAHLQRYKDRLESIKVGSRPDQQDIMSPVFSNNLLPADAKGDFTVNMDADPSTLKFR